MRFQENFTRASARPKDFRRAGIYDAAMDDDSAETQVEGERPAVTDPLELFWQLEAEDYSCRNATSGSTRAARRAGIHADSTATASSSATDIVRLTASAGCTL